MSDKVGAVFWGIKYYFMNQSNYVKIKKYENLYNQSRTNGPINAHLTIAQV